MDKEPKQTDQFQESAYHNRLADLDQLEALTSNTSDKSIIALMVVLVLCTLAAVLFLLSTGAN